MSLENEKNEILRKANLVGSKEQTIQKVDYYKFNLEGLGELHEAINETLNRGYNKSKLFILGFIPVIRFNYLNSEEKSRLKVELSDIEFDVQNKKKYYESWLSRLNEIDLVEDEITRECNENFDKVLSEAKKLEYNFRLMDKIKDYSNPNSDQRIKNEFYLYLKIEIINSQMNKNRK